MDEGGECPNICIQTLKSLADSWIVHVLGENPRNPVKSNSWKPEGAE